jgi:hypothetical protein
MEGIQNSAGNRGGGYSADVAGLPRRGFENRSRSRRGAAPVRYRSRSRGGPGCQLSASPQPLGRHLRTTGKATGAWLDLSPRARKTGGSAGVASGVAPAPGSAPAMLLRNKTKSKKRKGSGLCAGSAPVPAAASSPTPPVNPPAHGWASLLAFSFVVAEDLPPVSSLYRRSGLSRVGCSLLLLYSIATR